MQTDTHETGNCKQTCTNMHGPDDNDITHMLSVDWLISPLKQEATQSGRRIKTIIKD